MATPMVPKEYVRQQLASMGITMLSEEELESYTKDFARLIQEHIDESSSSDSSSLSETPQPSLSVETTPTTTYHPPTPGSAVFKTFPGNKENRVQLLPPSSPSANSFSLSPDKTNVSVMSNDESVMRNGRTVRRKVLRKCNGESRVFDESLSSSAPDSPVGGTPSHLSELLVSTGSSTEGSVREEGRRPHICKSFIRAPLVPPHLRGLKKSDPVSRYHEFHRLWEAQKPPGEKNRDRLRWHIREQLLQQDVPYFEPHRRPRMSELVPPPPLPDRKRAAVSWTIR